MLQTREPSSFYGHVNVTQGPLLPKRKVTQVSKELEEFHFYVRKCHILVRKVPILLTHQRERERERERASTRPSKDNERFVCFGKKKEKSA